MPGFTPGTSTLIGIVEANAILVKGKDGHGQSKEANRNNEYGHMMFEDKTVEPDTVYYYKVRAVDTAGGMGEFSAETSIETGK